MTDKPGRKAISRRSALKTVGAGVLGAAAHALPAFAAGSARKPNFLFIMADDLGYADLSCYGRREYRTPVLDRLATQGMRFTHGYANSAVCSPTRLALITGRYQYRLRAGLDEPLGGSGHGLDPAHPTLPSLLKKQGYHSALIGKWHLGSLPKYGPLQSGYDEFWGNRGGAIDYFSHGGSSATEPDLWDGDVRIDDVGYYTDMLAERSLEFLDARAGQPGKPWLLSLHFTAPHWPWQGPGDKAESDRIGGRLFHYDGGSLATYAEMVTALDAAIGRVLARLSERGMDGNTVVVFTSDNGGERFSDNWPFTGMKSELLERRPARAADRALAGAYQRRFSERRAGAVDGFPADVRGRRRRIARPAKRRRRYPPGPCRAAAARTPAVLAVWHARSESGAAWPLQVPVDRR